VLRRDVHKYHAWSTPHTRTRREPVSFRGSMAPCPEGTNVRPTSVAHKRGAVEGSGSTSRPLCGAGLKTRQDHSHRAGLLTHGTYAPTLRFRCAHSQGAASNTVRSAKSPPSRLDRQSPDRTQPVRQEPLSARATQSAALRLWCGPHSRLPGRGRRGSRLSLRLRRAACPCVSPGGSTDALTPLMAQLEIGAVCLFSENSNGPCLNIARAPSRDRWRAALSLVLCACARRAPLAEPGELRTPRRPEDQSSRGESSLATTVARSGHRAVLSTARICEAAHPRRMGLHSFCECGHGGRAWRR